MSYQVLARKWRPKTFQQLVGQEHVSQALINGLDQDRLHHAFLFTGTRGVGKTTIARILAKCLNCESGVSSTPCGECSSCVDLDEGRFVDMIEIDAASRTGVDDMRDLLESVQYTPTRGRYKVYIIDEVHMLSASSFNALLKTLEEPPPHVKFVLATTDPQKIPVTILSRCLRFNLRRLLPDQISTYLRTLVDTENIETESDALTVLARAADGSMRDGLSLLDQAIAFGGGKLAMSDLEKMLGLVDREHVSAMIRALASDNAQGMLGIVEDLVSQSRDLETVLLNLAETLHRITLVQCVPGYRDPERSDWESIEELAEQLTPEDAQLFYQIAIKGRAELGLAPDPRTGLEMTLLRMLAFRPADAATAAPVAGDPSGTARADDKPATKPRTAPVSTAAAPARKSAAKKIREKAKKDTPSPAPSDWVTLLEELNLSGQARELARNVQLQSRSDDRWDFAIAPSLRHLGSKNCISRLSEAISDRIGHAVNVRIVDDKARELKTAAALEERKVRQSMSEAEKAINDDPTVKELKEQMGAQLVEDSIQPIQ
ncbi:MAG: DNA polymerase III subunit gamma/tau [Xanthomonadales bacterium]|nr:DNA polymerase III subunit gamma/tau [Gammaproteobacteria bacterium]MBT8054125.1 DNA polymerase III subunit gamma/tau [Gammaproteobacteria bacterium]NND56124.1 DNA polymerase III subunit gamma/tau [Xanthomonadales bacterium]NNK51649.1 DNA polymerase III subunit gamma/tau [Xanthomonadales bacterium]